MPFHYKLLMRLPNINPKQNHYFKGYCTDKKVIMLFVYMKCRFTLSYRDLEEMMTIHGASIDHSSVQRWVKMFVHLIDKSVRKRKRSVNSSWRMDETYVRVKGKWVYLYRAVDKLGDTIEFCLRARRDGNAAKAFFRKAFKNNESPEKIAVDKSGSNKCALDYFNKEKEEADKYEIRQVKYLNNIVEQDHRFIKKRIKPCLGFKNFYSAAETIKGIENIRMIQKGQIEGQSKNQNSYMNFVEILA